MEIKDLKQAGITDKQQLRSFRMAERIKLLLRYHKLLYAVYYELGDDKFNLMLSAVLKKTKSNSSKKELERVSAYTGIPTDVIQQKTKKRHIVEARQVAMYLAKQNTKESLAKIGSTIGAKDHATVLHSCKTVANLIETNRSFREKWMPLLTIN